MAEHLSLSQPQYRSVVEPNLPAQMSDGVTLYADVHRPDAAGAFPVILMRVPYDKTAATPLNYVNYFVPRGYMVPTPPHQRLGGLAEGDCSLLRRLSQPS